MLQNIVLVTLELPQIMVKLMGKFGEILGVFTILNIGTAAIAREKRIGRWFISSTRGMVPTSVLEKEIEMRSTLRAIAAVMRAVRAMVVVTARIGGKLVSMLVPAPMPAIDELEPAPLAERDTGSVYAPIKALAYARLAGTMPTPQMLAAAGRLPTEWISAMTRPMLKAVILADDATLHRHMKGAETIRGVLRYDEQVIDEYRVAMLRERAREETAKRTMTPLRYA